MAIGTISLAEAMRLITNRATSESDFIEGMRQVLNQIDSDQRDIVTLQGLVQAGSQALGTGGGDIGGTINIPTIDDDAVVSSKIMDKNVLNQHIADNAIDNRVMGDVSVGTAELIDTSVTADKLATNAVTSEKILAGAVVRASIGTDQVDSEHLAPNAVETLSITDAAVTDEKVATGINASKISTGLLPLDQIPTPLTGKEAATATAWANARRIQITGSVLSEGVINVDGTGDIIIPTVLASNVTEDRTFSGSQRFDSDVTFEGSVTFDSDAVNFVAGTIVTADIADNAITSAKLGPDSVNGTHIVDNAIDSEHLADNAVETIHITDLAVTNDKLAGNLDARKISVSTLPQDVIPANLGTALRPVGINGNANSATTLATTRTFTMSGDVTAPSQIFNGGADVAFATDIANDVVGDSELLTTNTGTNGQFLQYQDGNLQWATASQQTYAAGTLLDEATVGTTTTFNVDLTELPVQTGVTEYAILDGSTQGRVGTSVVQADLNVPDDLNLSGTTLQLRRGTTVVDSVTLPETGASVTIADAAPASPENGDMWYDSLNSFRLFLWSSVSMAWIDASPAGANEAIGIATFSNTAPTGTLISGQLWYDEGTARMYVYDSDASAWIDASPAATDNDITQTELRGITADTDSDLSLVSDGNGGFKWAESGGSGGSGTHVEFFNTSSGIADIFTNIDVSGYDTAQFFGYVQVGKSGGSGAGTFAASVSFDGGTTILNLISTSQTTNHSVNTTTGTSVDISSINTLTFQAGTRVISGSGSGRSGIVRGTLILTNTLG